VTSSRSRERVDGAETANRRRDPHPSGAFLHARCDPSGMSGVRDLGDFDHPAWLTAAGTVGGYLVILAVMTVLLFLVPYLIFTAL